MVHVTGAVLRGVVDKHREVSVAVVAVVVRVQTFLLTVDLEANFWTA